MLSLLIRKEFLDSLLNQRFIALAIFSIVLMPLSAFINYKYYSARKASFDNQMIQYLENDEEEESSVLRAYRAPTLLSSLARGAEPYMPVYYEFESTSEGGEVDPTIPGNIEAQEFSTLSTFGSFDFLFLVQVVFSLLAILLAFDMIAGEKERGTLKAMLANRLPRDKVLLGKFIGGFAVLWITFVVGFLLLYLVLALFNPLFFEWAMMGRVGFIFLCSSLFLAGFFCLGLMVSSFCYSPRTAIVVLLVVWVVMQLVIPKAGEMIATVLVPVRAEYEVQVERRRVLDEEIGTMQEKAGELFAEISGKGSIEDAFQAMRSEDTWVDEFKEQYQILFRDSKRQQMGRLREITQSWEREKRRQRGVAKAVALFSPATALTFLISDAAGTGDLAFEQYRSAVEDQYQIVDREVFSKQESNRFSLRLDGMMLSSNFDGDPPALESVPPFTVPEPPINEVFVSNAWALGTLLFYLIVPFLVGYIRFLKYDVR